MIDYNSLLFTEQAKHHMITKGITKEHIKHTLQHGAIVKFINRHWKSHAHLKVAYKDVGGITKIDIVHHD
ncbi:MAG: hypothetical protein Q7R56_02435 [Nanoarchaeota archaeon]|nr:hypothetical protein [Nanoarchaeota archaeon]